MLQKSAVSLHRCTSQRAVSRPTHVRHGPEVDRGGAAPYFSEVATDTIIINDLRNYYQRADPRRPSASTQEEDAEGRGRQTETLKGAEKMGGQSHENLWVCSAITKTSTTEFDVPWPPGTKGDEPPV